MVSMRYAAANKDYRDLNPGEFWGVCPWTTKADKTAPCRFTTTDPKAWEKHFKDEHGTSTASMLGFNGRWSKRVLPKPWKGPKLTEAGTHFDPQGTDPGASVAFEYEGRHHTGVVWCQGRGKAVWVTPDEPIEGVLFVLVEKDYVLQVQQPKARTEAAA